VRGWALSTERIKHIEVIINNNKYFLQPGTEVRPDVAKAFPGIQRAEMSGFNSLVPLESANGVIELQVNVILFNDDYTELGKRTITIPNDITLPAKDKTNTKMIIIKLINKTSNASFFKLFYSNDLFKYFNSDIVFVKYDKNIGHVNNSILHIPVIANVVQLSWAVGADLYLDELDKTFFESLQVIKENMKVLYPGFSFAGNIYVDKKVDNQFLNNSVGQLFSGGVDSFATYIKHMKEKPALFYYLIYGSNHPIQKLLSDKINEFAKREGLSIYLIESNIMAFINEKELINDYRQCLPSDSWWAGVQHGMGTVALCAPLTSICNVNKVYIASAGLKNLANGLNDPWGSHPQIDNNVSWADVTVYHDGFEWSRQEKINFAIYEYIKETGVYPQLTVCNNLNREVSLNCSKCEKCYRTIIGLAVKGIDPNLCGFVVNNDTFNEIKFDLINQKFKFNIATLNLWKEIQDNIPDDTNLDVCGSKKFFLWFKTFRLNEGIVESDKRYTVI